MRLDPQSLQLSEDGILIRAPQGDIRLSKEGNEIRADYRGHQLINGSAQLYADTLKQAAIAYAESVTLPWSTSKTGEILIHDHEHYYEQTFSPHLQPLETLKHWLLF